MCRLGSTTLRTAAAKTNLNAARALPFTFARMTWPNGRSQLISWSRAVIPIAPPDDETHKAHRRNRSRSHLTLLFFSMVLLLHTRYYYVTRHYNAYTKCVLRIVRTNAIAYPFVTGNRQSTIKAVTCHLSS